MEGLVRCHSSQSRASAWSEYADVRRGGEAPQILKQDSFRDPNQDAYSIDSGVVGASPTCNERRTNPCRGDNKAPDFISFEDNDSSNPNNWSTKKKCFAVFVSVATVLNSTIGSTLAGGNATALGQNFKVSNQLELVLPTSIFLAGYVIGPLIFGPLSETYGRKDVMIGAFTIFTISQIGCALARTWAGLIVFRLIAGMAGSCPIAVVGGICADIYHEPSKRGRSMAIFMVATTWGPVFGPVISGYLSRINWNWPFWVALIIAGVTWIPLLLMPETYAPVILKRRAKKLRKERNDPSIVAEIEQEKTNLRHIVAVVLTRPVRMFLFEPIVLLTCLYLAFAYALFYIFLQSFPLIFGGIYGFSGGEIGLAFLPIGIGAILACVVYLAYDSFLRSAQAKGAPWSRSEEMRRLPLACMAGPFLVVSLFWTGWAARPGVHWLVPVAAGVPFGVGFLLLFMGFLNYLVDAYEIFAASAMAAASTSRSIAGAVLPFASRPMYRRLGVPWACSLLGFLSIALCVIPFLFIKFGDRIRERSEFCQYLIRKKKEEEMGKNVRVQEKAVSKDLEKGE